MHAGVLQLNWHCFEPIHGILTADCTHIYPTPHFVISRLIFKATFQLGLDGVNIYSWNA